MTSTITVPQSENEFATEKQVDFAAEKGIEGVTPETPFAEAYTLIGERTQANPLSEAQVQERQRAKEARQAERQAAREARQAEKQAAREVELAEREAWKAVNPATDAQKAAIMKLSDGKVQVVTRADADAFFKSLRAAPAGS